MKTLITASALALTIGTTSQANELDDLLIGLDNTQVSFTGEIGYVGGMSTEIYIKTEAMSRPIYGQVALNREQFASIQECQLRAKRCTADIKAELTFSEGQIVALVFEVASVTPLN